MQAFFARHNIKAQKIAVGVSGGADSLALALMLKEQLGVFGYEIIALTVDHHLRPSSSDEALYVSEIMQQFGIEHHILSWHHCDTNGSLEEKARKARYTLLQQWCVEHDVKILAVAHHLRDQAETFLMRLQRGSGLKGLCAMQDVTNLGQIQLVRPLLNTNPDKLKQYLQNKNIAWVNDESNNDTAYLRNRIRHFLPLLEQQTGISYARIVSAINNLQSAESYIMQNVQKIMMEQICAEKNGVYDFAYTDFISWHSEMQFRILAELCKREYIPRAERVKRIINSLTNLPFKSACLGKNLILLAYNRIWIVPEKALTIKANKDDWAKFVAINPEYKERKIPHAARLAIMHAEEQKQ